jgi:hypothetical protein
MQLIACAATEKHICSDHREPADIESIAMKYSGTKISLSINWQGIASELALSDVKLHEMYESTQNWNEYIKGVALAHNACSGSKSNLGRQIERYNQIRSAKQALEKLLDKIPPNGQIPPELAQQIRETFNSYHKLVTIETFAE